MNEIWWMTGYGRKSGGWPPQSKLALAVVGVVQGFEEIFGASYLAVVRAGDQGVGFDYAFFGACDGDAVDVEGTAEGAFVIGFGFGEIG